MSKAEILEMVAAAGQDGANEAPDLSPRELEMIERSFGLDPYKLQHGSGEFRIGME